MPPKSWLALTVAAAFLLLGIAGSSLAWILLRRRRSRWEQPMELTWRKLADQVRALHDRLSQLETIDPPDSQRPGLMGTGSRGGRGAGQVLETLGRAPGDVIRPAPGKASRGRGLGRAESPHEPPLIAVPSLEGAPNDREATVDGLKERYAAIWTLADTGASAEVIARATGQPVGQIELILGLRRRIDGTKSLSRHAPHVPENRNPGRPLEEGGARTQ